MWRKLPILGKSFRELIFYCVLSRKKAMKELFALMAIAALPCCGMLDTEEMILSNRRCDIGEWIGKKPGTDNPADAGDLRDTTVFITTVEFPDDYFWQRDTAGENRIFNITVYREGDRILSVKGGPGTNISSDPDMNRFIDGHLYSDYSSGTETIISRDGKEMFRYEGREMLCGFIVKENDIYTLGQNRSGNGLSFRKNGETLFSTENGIVIGELYCPDSKGGGLHETDAGDILFYYKTDGLPALLLKTRLFAVKNGVEEELALDPNITKIYDARIISETLYIACAEQGLWKYPILYIGGRSLSLSMSAGYALANCRLRRSGEDVYLKTDFSYDSWQTAYSAVWDSRGVRTGPDRSFIYEFYTEKDSYAYIYTDNGGKNIRINFTADDEHAYSFISESGYKFLGSGSAAICGDRFYAGLASMQKGGHPLIVYNGTASSLKINGFISGIDILTGKGGPEEPA